MRRFLEPICWAVLAWLATGHAAGFTLLGPFSAWQTPRLGYNDVANVPGDANGGPMNLGEGYRWNTPNIYYSYSPDFLHYFGARGVAEIEKAIAIMNSLPSMDGIVVDRYPLQSMRVNYRATALQLFDLKSLALSVVLKNMGLTDPTRYVFTLRNRITPPNATNYYVVQRNFDPQTFDPTPYINGQLWTYTSIQELNNGADSLAVTEPVDPLALGGLINAPVTFPVANNNAIAYGSFWTGLTRDDVGGLRYLYRSSNLNVETAPPGSSLFIPGSTTVTSGSGSASGSPWTVPDIPATGTTGTGTGGVTPTAANTNIVNQAVRPGMGKFNFVRINYESTFGQFPTNNVSYADRYLTNGVQREQNVVRQLLAPDLLFDAQDLQGGDATATFLALQNTITFQNNDAINGQTGGDGPGNILPSGTATPAVVIAFNKVGPALENFQPFFLSEVSATKIWNWGSFDGSTNAPVVYPSGASVAALEQAALSGQTGSGGAVASVGIWTPADIVLLPPGANIGGGTTGAGGTGVTP